MMKNALSPRRLPYRPWYLMVTLLTAVLTLLPLFRHADRAISLGANLAEACSSVIQLAMLAGLVLPMALPGRSWGYRLCVIVLRIWNTLLAALLGVLVLAMVALAVIACLGVLNLPVAAGMAGLLLAIGLMMLICTMLVHHVACCAKEAGGSAKAGVWHSRHGHEGPVPALAWGMTAISALLLTGMALCAADATHPWVQAVYDAGFDALYATVPTAARTMIRTLRTSLEPMLKVTGVQLVLQAVSMLRFAALAMLYRDYRKLHR